MRIIIARTRKQAKVLLPQLPDNMTVGPIWRLTDSITWVVAPGVTVSETGRQDLNMGAYWVTIDKGSTLTVDVPPTDVHQVHIVSGEVDFRGMNFYTASIPGDALTFSSDDLYTLTAYSNAIVLINHSVVRRR